MKYSKKQVNKLISLIQKHCEERGTDIIYSNISNDIFEHTVEVWEHPWVEIWIYFCKYDFNKNIYLDEGYCIPRNDIDWEKTKDKNYCKQHAIEETGIRSYDTLRDMYENTFVEDEVGLWDYIKSLESAEVVEDFIYKVDDSSKLTIQSNCSSIEEFFAIDTDAHINIIAIDTKEIIAKIKRLNNSYKFIVDLTNEDGDAFNIKTTIKTKANLNKLIEQTVEALRVYPQFSKYADDLESTIS